MKTSALGTGIGVEISEINLNSGLSDLELATL
jgi:hypothetical protein